MFGGHTISLVVWRPFWWPSNDIQKTIPRIFGGPSDYLWRIIQRTFGRPSEDLWRTTTDLRRTFRPVVSFRVSRIWCLLIVFSYFQKTLAFYEITEFIWKLNRIIKNLLKSLKWFIHYKIISKLKGMRLLEIDILICWLPYGSGKSRSNCLVYD